MDTVPCFAEVLLPWRGVVAYARGGWIGVCQPGGRIDEVRAEFVVTSGTIVPAVTAQAAAELVAP